MGLAGQVFTVLTNRQAGHFQRQAGRSRAEGRQAFNEQAEAPRNAGSTTTAAVRFVVRAGPSALRLMR
ncbi:MAG: hypothetical protein ACLSVD_03785 [Eggerthellaceae bacterium]